MSNTTTMRWFGCLKQAIQLPRRTLRTAVLTLGATALRLGEAAHAQSTVGKTRHPSYWYTVCWVLTRCSASTLSTAFPAP